MKYELKNGVFEEIPYEILKLMSKEEVQVRFKCVELFQDYVEKVGKE